MNIPRLLFGLLLGRRLPITSGTLKVPGITRLVVIRRDQYGIPYIEANTHPPPASPKLKSQETSSIGTNYFED